MWDITFCVNKECTKTDCMRHHTKAEQVPKWHPVYQSHFNKENKATCEYYSEWRR